jgi:ParB-like chromosome segregation protein Spo0J
MTTSIIESIRAAEAEEKAKAMKANEPTINPEFRDLLDVQSEVSYEELKKMIEAEGVRDPIVVWAEKNQIADGHNRFQITKELGIPCPRIDKSFADEAEVKTWIIRNQLGRRNLTPARFEYYIGKLYNEQKAETTEEKLAGGGNVAEKLAEEFEISEKTVRRYGTTAKGIDAIERIRGKLEKNKQLSNKPTYTSEEVAIVGQASNTTVAAKTLKNIDDYKKVKAAKKQEDKAVKAAVIDKQTYYGVALCEPEFATSGFSVSTEPKPTLDKNAACYIIVPDEYLPEGIDLIRKWGLRYEATFIYWSATKIDDGMFSKIVHRNVLMATKGQITGPKSGSEAASCVLHNGDIGPAVVKLIDGYHNGNTKKLDMRRGAKASGNWEIVSAK